MHFDMHPLFGWFALWSVVGPMLAPISPLQDGLCTHPGSLHALLPVLVHCLCMHVPASPALSFSAPVSGIRVSQSGGPHACALPPWGRSAGQARPADAPASKVAGTRRKQSKDRMNTPRRLARHWGEEAPSPPPTSLARERGYLWDPHHAHAHSPATPTSLLGLVGRGQAGVHPGLMIWQSGSAFLKDKVPMRGVHQCTAPPLPHAPETQTGGEGLDG